MKCDRVRMLELLGQECVAPPKTIFQTSFGGASLWGGNLFRKHPPSVHWEDRCTSLCKCAESDPHFRKKTYLYEKKTNCYQERPKHISGRMPLPEITGRIPNHILGFSNLPRFSLRTINTGRMPKQHKHTSDMTYIVCDSYSSWLIYFVTNIYSLGGCHSQRSLGGCRIIYWASRTYLASDCAPATLGGCQNNTISMGHATHLRYDIYSMWLVQFVTHRFRD